MIFLHILRSFCCIKTVIGSKTSAPKSVQVAMHKLVCLKLMIDFFTLLMTLAQTQERNSCGLFQLGEPHC